MLAVATSGSGNAAVIGLALVYCLQLMGLTSWTMMTFVQLEATMTSLERVLDISHISPETQPCDESSHTKQMVASTVPDGWPQAGAVSFINTTLRYREGLPLALSGLNVDIGAGERIGVCGRTGAGKSSIMVLLFRLFEPGPGSRILIDGVNTADLELHALRSRLAIIPQDPVVFSGKLLRAFLRF